MGSLLWPENVVFTTALALMLGIGLLEGVATVMGMGFSNLIDNLLPDTDADLDLDPGIDTDADGDFSIGHTNALSALLGWLCIGKVPVLVVLVVMLTVFGLSGLIAQNIVAGVIGFPITAWIAAPAVFVATLPVSRMINLGFARLIPKEESSSVSRGSFIGRTAVITLGATRRGVPSQAKLTDEHDQTHYVMVEPDLDDDEFQTGDEVLLVRQTSSVFRVIRASHPHLTDD